MIRKRRFFKSIHKKKIFKFGKDLFSINGPFDKCGRVRVKKRRPPLFSIIHFVFRETREKEGGMKSSALPLIKEGFFNLFTPGEKKRDEGLF